MPQSSGSATKRDPHAQTRLAYAYLQELAASGEPYSDEDMIAKTGWKGQTVSTHRSKKWRAWVKRDPMGVWTVSPTFQDVSEREFVDFHRQRTDFYATYQRRMYRSVVTYEFLLPLTKERELTKALDALSYSDTVKRLIREVSVDSFRPQFPDVAEMAEDEGLAHIVNFVADHFTGYSITHVSGRFRAGEMVSRAEAGEVLAAGRRYLVDETTAVVRFIVPLEASRNRYRSDDNFLGAVVVENPDSELSEPVRAELAKVRRTFFPLFAEAVIRTVKGEDEVWLLESGPENRLYVWEKA